MKRIKKLFRKVDIYALPITLRYKSEKKFYTNFGALTSVILIVAMLGFATSFMLAMLADENPTVQQKTAFISEKDKELESSGGGFLFGFRILDSETGEDFLDLSYAHPVITTYTNTWNPQTKAYVERPQNYVLEACDVDFLKGLNSNLQISDPSSLVRA